MTIDERRAAVRAALFVTALVWVPWSAASVSLHVWPTDFAFTVLLLWHILFLPFRAVSHPTEPGGFSAIGAGLLDVIAWLVIAAIFGLLARRLATRWQLALTPVVLIAGGRLLVLALLGLGYRIEYDVP